MILAYFFTLLFSFAITYFLTPLVKKLAVHYNAIDIPDERKVHESPIPRWGGISVVVGILAGVLFAYCSSETFRVSLREIHSAEIWGIAGACFLMFGVGLADDVFPVPAKLKLVFQIIAALWLVHQGVEITFVTNPFSHQLIYLRNVIGVAVSVLWIIGITNALNLLDGLDGLLAGISTISAFALLGVALEKGQIFPAFLLIAMAGSTLAFLRYNFNPAQIFLGDSGSLFLGMLWASLSIAGALKTSTVTVVAPLLILGIPIADTIFAVFRRFGKGQSIFQPDRDHLHHRLLNLGWSQRQIVLAFYALGGFLSALALFLNHWFK